MKQENIDLLQDIFLFLSLGILAVMLIMQPQRLCERWGGELYSDGCYITANLSYCKTEDGVLIEQKAGIQGITSNFSFNEEEE